MWLGRNMPRRVGYSLVKLLTAYIVRQKDSSMARNIRLNQSVVRGLPMDAPELDDIVRTILLNAGRGYYELYHRLGKGFESVREAVTFSPDLFAYLEEIRDSEQGALFVGPHLGNLDLGLMSFAAHGLDIQAITYALPPGGYELQNRLRASAGWIITPADAQAVKMALRRLRAGGIVITGVDRPLAEHELAKPVHFFGLPSPVPTGYMRLAHATQARVHMVEMENTGNGKYTINVTPPLELIETKDRQEFTFQNTELILKEAAKLIRARPDEWMMFHPVWPQLLES